MTAEDFINNIDATKLRATTINWQNLLKEIVDGYNEYRGILHGLQKDAVQNSWDARVNKKGENFSVIFQLIEKDNKKFFIINDKGTHGLTGRVLMPEELDKDLLPEERWGRFENVAFTKDPSEGALGSRGRGKFTFVAASKNRIILYDTFRGDGTYRFGFRALKKTESPIAAFDGEEAKNMLSKATEGLIQPLAEVGTRVIIVEPLDELIENIKSGIFLKNINESWWEIIKKFKAKIFVQYDGKSDEATIPEEFNLIEKDDKEHLVWIKENLPFINDCRIVKLHIISNKRINVPEEFKGISIQRGGMKICCLEPEALPPEIAGTIYGYVAVNKEAESFLREAEGVEHYSINFRKTIPQSMKHLILKELHYFAQQKLGWNVDPRAIRHQRQKNAERIAISVANKIAREAGLTGMGGGGGGGGGGSTWKDIRIKMQDLIFPRKNDLRINYKEKLENIGIEVINDTDNEIKLRAKMFLNYDTAVLKVYTDEELSLPPKSTSNLFGPFTEIFTERDFPSKGKYTITARIISLRPEDKAEILDIKKRIFYLEQDPEQKGLFEKCDAINYPKKVIKLMGEAVPGEGNGYIFQYNISHPAFMAVEDEEEEIAAYLFRLMAQEICRIDLMQENPKLFKQEDKKSPEIILSKTLRILGEFNYKFCKG